MAIGAGSARLSAKEMRRTRSLPRRRKYSLPFFVNGHESLLFGYLVARATPRFTASFTSPTASRTLPFAWSILPSPSSSSLPVALPTLSYTAPLIWSAAPFTCCLSISLLHEELGPEIKRGAANVVPKAALRGTTDIP